ncbi:MULTISPECIES: signal peptidase II [Streptomyces]|uniref:Lipoprotein signal peptidase n=1 Tax=Streptomyces eurythermus TaxID=42237 RepID=A0ABW6YVP2_9ACTN|nr:MULTISPECIES: signal peptidase II [Streptomyces]QIS70593.1 signal peptidase II [Streptomyces sp. DSM 40868]WDM11658.1 signal peptidase II [Streptomyces lavenduligriseus]
MAEAERIIGTPDTPDDDHQQTAAAGTADAAQAAGASGEAGTDGATGRQTAHKPGRGRRIAVLFSVAAFAYALDLISKMLVVARLEGRAPIRVVGDLLELHVIRNPGAAFSFGAAFTVIFSLIAAIVIVVIIRLARKLYSFPWAIALGLLLGGALGNLTDRIFRAPGVFEGAVVDFIAPKGFAVFNLADSAIVCGGILIVVLSFYGLDPDGTVHKD